MPSHAEILASLDPAAEPRLVFVRRAPRGIGERPGTLLCLDASFNPLTVAHVALVAEAARGVPPDEVLLLLAKTNVDKDVTGFPLEARLAMLDRFVALRPETSLAVVSHARFADKVAAIRPHYPPTTRLLLLLGYDTLLRLFDPKYYADPDASLRTLFAEAEVIVANRAPDPPAAVADFLTRPQVRLYAPHIHPIRLPDAVAAISASRVRACLAKGEPIADLVPPEILPLLMADSSLLEADGNAGQANE
jgi:nicotinamide-nucleotide adenylyltransferase